VNASSNQAHGLPRTLGKKRRVVHQQGAGPSARVTTSTRATELASSTPLTPTADCRSIALAHRTLASGWSCFLHPQKATNTVPGFNRGSGGRGCDF